MTPFEELVSRRWILKEEDSELYYRVKDALKEIKKSVQEKFGYVIIQTPYLIKMEKIPGKIENWMGIEEFQSIREYQMFCFILMFLEDKEREEQFLLSTLTEYIQLQFSNGEIKWTDFTTRRQLIRVIKYCVKIHILKQNDGDEDRFAQSIDTEVLYENTGISRYVMRNFMREIKSYNEPKDFEQSEWVEMNEDRGIIRRQRVYRRLLLSPGVYRGDKNDEDFAYIRNRRNQIQTDFQSFFPCDLHVHESSAYLILDEDCQVGKVFPFNNTYSDLVLLIFAEVRKRVKSYQYHLGEQEQLYLKKEQFVKLCKKSVENHIQYLPKKYQEMGAESVAQEVINLLISYGFMDDLGEEVQLYPVFGKIVGGFTNKEDLKDGK